MSHFSGNCALNLLHFEFIKTSRYPLVELAGAESITPSFTGGTHKLLAHELSSIQLFRHSEIKDLDKTCQLKTHTIGKLAGEMSLV